MAFDTGVNISTQQEKSSAKLTNSGRMAAEPVGNAAPRIFNLIEYLLETSTVDSEGRRSVNVNGSDIIPVPPINPTSSEESVNLDALPVKHNLFYDDMRTGLNTRDKWWAASLTNTVTPEYDLLPRSINQTVPAGRGWSTTWDRDKEILSVDIEHNTQNMVCPFVFQSKNYIKIPSSGSTFFIFGGTYEPQTTATLTMSYSIRLFCSDVSVPVSDWNMDQFQLPGNDGTNPSMIGLDMSVNQQPTFRVMNGKGGGMVFGFTIDGHFHPAHLISSQNYTTSQGNAIGNLNLTARRSCERFANGNSVRWQAGFSDSLNQYSGAPSGIYFESAATFSPAATLRYQIKETSIFSTGAPSNNLQQVPFTADCIANVSAGGSPYPIYTQVQGTEEGVEILALRLTPNFNGATAYNKATFYPTKLDVHVKGDVETDAVLCQVWYNGKNPGGNVYFPVNPQSSIDKSVSTRNIQSGQQTGVKLGSILVGVGERASLDIPFLYANSEVRMTIDGQDVGDFDYITVVAVGEGTSSASTAVSVVLSGIEEY